MQMPYIMFFSQSHHRDRNRIDVETQSCAQETNSQSGMNWSEVGPNKDISGVNH